MLQLPEQALKNWAINTPPRLYIDSDPQAPAFTYRVNSCKPVSSILSQPIKDPEFSIFVYKTKELSLCTKLFLIPISLRPNVVELRYFKQGILLDKKI